MTNEYEFAHGPQFMNAIRSSGYENAAMAVGELVDNSIQAGAENVDVLITEHRVTPNKRQVRRIKNVGVLDDGKGMEKNLLRRALKLGDGTHFDDKSGIGKFGVGLPQASVSQAKRLDVWTWQDGIDNAVRTYIDLDDDEWLQNMVISEPQEEEIPDKWRSMSDFDHESGTLVVWSKVDRCTWKKANTLFRHSQDLIGRMYRNWLKSDSEYTDVNISLTIYDEDNKKVSDEKSFRPNDPLYLMEDTTVTNKLPDECPDPPFEKFSETTKNYKISSADIDEEPTKEAVELTFSVSKPEARQKRGTTSAGSLPHGKHAKENIGVSILREGRELHLDKSWVDKDPRNRWWGAKVEFGRKMDDIFGVTNNKQRADRLSSVANKTWKDFGEEGESVREIKDRLEEEDFPTYVCLDIKETIDNQISHAFEKVEEIGEHGGDDEDTEEKRHEDTPEKKGTEVAKERKETGDEGTSDEEEELSEEEKQKELQDRLEAQGLDDHTIEEVTGEVVDHGLKFSFVEKPFPGNAIFSVEPTAGAILIGLNEEHAAYEELFSSLELEDEEEIDDEDAVEKLQDANDALKLLLEAWARMEDESEGQKRNKYKDIRSDWGSVARDFLE
jgi:hypothetical protein